MNKLTSNKNATRLTNQVTDNGIEKFKPIHDVEIEKVDKVVSFKVTDSELEQLNELVKKIQNLKGGRVAKAKLLRALCCMGDAIDEAKLIAVIRDIS